MIKYLCDVNYIIHIAWDICGSLPELDPGKNMGQGLDAIFFPFYKKLSSNWEKNFTFSLCPQIKVYQHITTDANS